MYIKPSINKLRKCKLNKDIHLKNSIKIYLCKYYRVKPIMLKDEMYELNAAI